MKLDGKNIVITGATSGIGLNILDYIMQHSDCNICAVGRNEDKLKRLKKIYGNRLFTIKCDVAIEENVDDMFTKLFEKSKGWNGNVDIFIANAGFGYYEKIRKPDWGHIENIFAVNTFSPIYSLLKMQKYKRGKKIQFVIIASGVAKVPLPGYSLYSATKAAIDAFTEAFLYEKDKNAIVSIAYPVAVRTPFYKKGKDRMKEPLLRQSIHANTKNIVKGIIKNEKYIYPSPMFELYLILRNFLPITQVYRFIENTRFKK